MTCCGYLNVLRPHLARLFFYITLSQTSVLVLPGHCQEIHAFDIYGQEPANPDM